MIHCDCLFAVAQLHVAVAHIEKLAKLQLFVTRLHLRIGTQRLLIASGFVQSVAQIVVALGRAFGSGDLTKEMHSLFVVASCIGRFGLFDELEIGNTCMKVCCKEHRHHKGDIFVGQIEKAQKQKEQRKKEQIGIELCLIDDFFMHIGLAHRFIARQKLFDIFTTKGRLDKESACSFGKLGDMGIERHDHDFAVFFHEPLFVWYWSALLRTDSQYADMHIGILGKGDGTGKVFGIAAICD